MTEQSDVAARLDRLRVGDIMVPLEAYPKVRTTTTLREAVKVMEESKLEVAQRRSLPRVLLVFNEQGKLAGMVRRRDIMRGLEPEFLVAEPLDYRKKLFDVSIDPNLSLMSYDKLVRGVRRSAERPIKSVLRPIVVSVDYDDHIIKAVYEMVSYGLSLLPVLRAKKLVGVVRSVEVFHELGKLVQ